MSPASGDQRAESRGHFHVLWDVIFRALRAGLAQWHNFRLAVGVFLIGGLVLAVIGTLAFVQVASRVRAGSTQTFDEAVLTWIGEHRLPWLEAGLLEVTMLGTGVVVFMIVGVAGMFLWLTRHHYSTALLLASTLGGLVLNYVMKMYFDRPRPQVFEWVTTPVSSSFPSGHAMSAAIVYTTVAYLAARLQRRRWERWLTMVVAFLIIGLIAFSRMYLGVHYPSDVAAGIIIGLAWTGFCMATLEAIQKFGQRGSRVREEVRAQEEPPPAPAT